MSWRQRVLDSIRALTSNERFTVRELLVRPGVNDRDFENIRERYYGYLTSDLEEFYRSVNGFRFNWETPSATEDWPTLRGSVQIVPLEELFLRPIPDPEGVKFEFDQFYSEASAALLYRGGGSEPIVQFYLEGEATVDTGRTLTEYLECLLQTRGFFYWIQALSYQTNMNPEASRLRRFAPTLFPDLDLSLFEPR